MEQRRFPETIDESFRVVLGEASAPDPGLGYGHWFASADDPRTSLAMTPLPA